MGKGKLGRGLDSLLKRDEVAVETPPGVMQVPVDMIHPNRYQPRTEFNVEALADLASSIAAKGIIQPLVVRPDADGYELIAGERRWRAASQLGLEMVPVVVLKLAQVGRVPVEMAKLSVSEPWIVSGSVTIGVKL